MKKRVSSAVFAVIMLFSLCIGSFVPTYAAEKSLTLNDTDGSGGLGRRDIREQRTAAFGEEPVAFEAVVSKGVRKIEDTAFYQSGITKITIPESVTDIGRQAFLECRGLTSITLPASLKNIDGTAFEYCDNLAEINVSPANTVFASKDGILYSKDFSTIYSYPSARSNKKVILPEGLTTIKQYVFARTNIEEVTFPASLKTIESYAFTECKALKSLVLPEGITTIEEGAFDQCYALTGDLVLPKSITKYGNQAFRMTGLKNITINSNVNLTEMMFIGSGSLETVKINGEFPEIGPYAFASCPKLKSIILPKTLKVINTLAFDSCSSLPEIILPEGLTQMGQKVVIARDSGVFNNCTSLKGIIIPNSVVYVEESAFIGCKSLKTVTLSKNVKFNLAEKRIFSGCTSLESIVIPKNITTIGQEAFAGSGLKKLTIEPNGCKYIGQAAFKATLLTEVVLPVGVETMGYLSFAGINPLKTVTLGSTIKSVDTFTFYEVPSVTTVNMISLKKIPIAVFNFEDKTFIDKGMIHVPKNFLDASKAPDGKLYVQSRKVVKDLPTLPKGKAGY